MAASYNQLAYQAESAPWRDFYLTGAKELLQEKKALSGARWYLTSALKPDQFFDVIATRINGYKYDSSDLELNIHFSDTNENVLVIYKNGVLSNRVGKQSEKASIKVTGEKQYIYALFSKQENFKELESKGKVKVDGNLDKLIDFLSYIENPNGNFNIVEPQFVYDR